MERSKKAQELYDTLHVSPLDYDKEYQQIMNDFIYGDVYQHGTMDLKTRELISIVANVTNHTLKTLKEHVVAGLNCDLSPIAIKEAVYQCTPYVGMGKAEDALEVVNQTFIDYSIKLPLLSQKTVTEETRFEKGFEVQSTAFTKEAIQGGHDQAPKELKHIQNYLSEYCFGDFYTRNGLDLKQRELITFIMLSTLGGCENQLRSHVGANIRVGNSRDLLIEAITQCIPYIGFPRTLNAINIINEVTL